MTFVKTWATHKKRISFVSVLFSVHFLSFVIFIWHYFWLPFLEESDLNEKVINAFREGQGVQPSPLLFMILPFRDLVGHTSSLTAPIVEISSRCAKPTIFGYQLSSGGGGGNEVDHRRIPTPTRFEEKSTVKRKEGFL